MSSNDSVFWKKVLLSFVRGVIASLVVTVPGILASPDFKFERALWISLLIGAVAAGFRAVQAYFTNLEPGDAQHGRP